MATAAAAASLDRSPGLESRYLSGYRLARTISNVSQVARAIGLLAGIFVVFFGLMGSETLMRPNPSMIGIASLQSQHYIYLLSVIFFGALVSMIGWAAGLLMQAYAEHLKAVLDAAVNGSPFLSDVQRAAVMRL